MKILRQQRWMRRGFSLLWDASSLAQVAAPNEAVSMREFFSLRQGWPEDLPSANGDALVVAGLEGCLDVLSREDALAWLEGELKEVILDFQEFYKGDAALILWVPSGRRRIGMIAATDQYTWRLPAPNSDQILELGRSLWAGAETDVARIMDPHDPQASFIS